MEIERGEVTINLTGKISRKRCSQTNMSLTVKLIDSESLTLYNRFQFKLHKFANFRVFVTFVLHSITESILPSVVGGLVGVLIGVAMINVARFLGYSLFK